MVLYEFLFYLGRFTELENLASAYSMKSSCLKNNVKINFPLMKVVEEVEKSMWKDDKKSNGQNKTVSKVLFILKNLCSMKSKLTQFISLFDMYKLTSAPGHECRHITWA